MKEEIWFGIVLYFVHLKTWIPTVQNMFRLYFWQNVFIFLLSFVIIVLFLFFNVCCFNLVSYQSFFSLPHSLQTYLHPVRSMSEIAAELSHSSTSLSGSGASDLSRSTSSHSLPSLSTSRYDGEFTPTTHPSPTTHTDTFFPYTTSYFLLSSKFSECSIHHKASFKACMTVWKSISLLLLHLNSIYAFTQLNLIWNQSQNSISIHFGFFNSNTHNIHKN